MDKVYITHEASGGAAWVPAVSLRHYLPNGWVEADPPAPKKAPAKKAAKKAAAKAAPTPKDQE